MTPSSQTPFTSSTICLTDAPAGGAFSNLRHDLERGRERDGGSTDRCTDRNDDDDDDDVGWREGWSWGHESKQEETGELKHVRSIS